QADIKKLGFTFGIDLGSTGDFQLVGAAPGGTPGNGRLSGDAHFAVTVGTNAAVNVTVPKDDSNTSVADLVNDVNQALRTAGLQTVNEDAHTQTVTLTPKSTTGMSGKWTLALGTSATTQLALDAPASDVQKALAALQNVGAGNVTV